MNKLALWLLEIRSPFLLLSVVLVFLGTSVAVWEGFFDAAYFALALAGLILLHISVNVLNEYSDFKTRIDFETPKTPFSGGSGILVAGLLEPESAKKLGLISLSTGVIIGLYFIAVRGLLLLPIVAVGALSVYFYTTHLSRWMVGEVFAGLGLGALPILGSYFVQTGGYSAAAALICVVPGILTFNLLFLNEFPDVEPDRKAGRRNLVIALGRKKASRLYAATNTIIYIWILLGIIFKAIPIFTLLGLLTIPFAVKATKGAARDYDEVAKLIPSLAANVMIMLITQALLGIGFIVSRALGL